MHTAELPGSPYRRAVSPEGASSRAVLERFSVSGDGFARSAGDAGAEAEFVHPDGGGVRVEFVSYAPERTARGGEAINEPGAAHLSLSIEGVDAFYRDLTEDVETVSEPVTTESGSRVLFVRDLEGNPVEHIAT